MKAFRRDDGTGNFFELHFHFQKLNYKETQGTEVLPDFAALSHGLSNLYRINFQPHHADVDFALPHPADVWRGNAA